MALDGMAATLQARVHMQLSDGRLAPLRLWGQRERANAARDSDEAQRPRHVYNFAICMSGSCRYISINKDFAAPCYPVEGSIHLG